MNYSQAIVDAILELQRKNRNISAQELTTNIILILLSQKKEMNLTSLTEFLNCPQSYLTHFLKRLIKRKLIRMRQDSKDLRFRYYSLSASGEAEVKSLDRHYDDILRRQEKSLAQSEITILAGYFSRFSNAAGIVAQYKREHEHIIRPEQRRLAALLGVTGRTLFGQRISPTTFHIFQLISRYNGLLTTKDLADELNLTSAQISSTLKIFCDEYWCSYLDNPFDERSKLIELTAKGDRYHKEIAKMLYHSITYYLDGFNQSELRSFKDLSERFVKTSMPIIEVPMLKHSQARTDILETCYLNGTLNSVPERIAGKKDKLFGLEIRNKILCYVQVQEELNQVNLVAWQPNTSLLVVQNLLLESIFNTGAKLDPSCKVLNLFAKSLSGAARH